MRAAKILSPRVSLLAKSSREASPKIPQEEAASLTTQGGFSLSTFSLFLSTFSLAVSPPPLQENQNLSPPARLEPSQLHFSPTSLETHREREKNVWGTHRGGAGKRSGTIFQRWKTGGRPWISQPWSKHLPLAGIF